MSNSLFPSPPWPALPVNGERGTYPLHRVFCVGRNYAAHAAEMGSEVDREDPIFFTKSALAYLPSGMDSPYPPGTDSYHHEIELVVALGAPLFRADATEAETAIYGYAVGLDMTRRDLQERAKDRGLPWDTAKDVEESAIIGPITRKAEADNLSSRRIRLTVDGAVKQDATLNDMIWSIPELISRLSHLYHLAPGDVMMTGTPAGVGAVRSGNHLVGEIDGLSPVSVTFSDPE